MDIEKHENGDLTVGLDTEFFSDDYLSIGALSNDIEFFGSDEQRTEMLTSWVKYLSVVKNPATTKENTYFKVGNKAARYAPLDEILNLVRGTLSKHGFAFFQNPTFNDTSGSVAVKLLLVHTNGGVIAFAPLEIKLDANKINAQTIGSAISYARRFQLNSILGIAGENEDDDGNSASGNQGESAKATAKIAANPNAKLREEMVAMCGEKAKVNRAAVDAAVKAISTTGKLDGIQTKEQIDSLISKLKEIK